MSMRGPARADILPVLTVLLLITAVFGCGKKGDPTLRSYERPETPSGLSIVHREDSLFLTWTYPQAKEYLLAQFLVLRSAGSAFEKLALVDKESRSYIDTEIATGSTYAYKVIAQSLRGVNSMDPAAVSASPVTVPQRPAKLSYSVSGNAVILVWEPAVRGTLFNVYRSTERGKYGMKPINPEPLSEPQFRDTFSLQTVFHYTVRSLTDSNARNEGPAADEVTVDARELVPAMPRDLQAFPASDRVFLSWTEFNEPWVTGFRVYRRSGAGEFMLLGSTQTPTFLDPEAPVSQRDYRVTAVGIATEGPAAEIRDVLFLPQR